MYIRDYMATNVVTVSRKTPVVEVRKFMRVHNITRVPVVDRGKLVDIVNDRRLAQRQCLLQRL